MRIIKNIIGILSLIIGVFGGIYVGGWCMFIQPIIETCRAFDAGTLTGLMVGITVLKCVFAGSVGLLIFSIFYFIGMILIYNAFKLFK